MKLKRIEAMHGFTFEEPIAIEEIGAVAHRAVYKKNGAELLFLEREDTNKTFAITFKTIPEDSTGVFHILEHSVLCGSQKYPVKEPFVELLKGSLKTFLNAFTFSDKTMYPVSSRNEKDFLNLVDVYMDAVLNPVAVTRPDIFRQEGWHYEVGEGRELSYKGVVFNEMKGAYSSADEIELELMSAQLYRGTPYAYDSGGDPEVIPTLTYEAFVNAHRRYYHPSNARIFLDGKVDLDKTLALLDGYLCGYERVEVKADIARVVPSGRSEREVEYEISDSESPEGKCRVCLGFMTHGYEDRRTGIALGVIMDAIAGTNDSPFRRAMLDSGLVEDASFISYDGIMENSVVLELKNVRREDMKRAEALAIEVIESIVRDGIDRSALGASFSAMEFRVREQDSAGFPQGINYAIAVHDTWLYGGDPTLPLFFEEDIRALREAMDTRYYEDLLSRIFLSSKHSAALYMIPSATLGKEREVGERARLCAAREALSDAELERIIAEGEALVTWQATPDSEQALETLPSLSVEDIDPEPEKIHFENYKIDTVPALYTPVQSKGITYARLLFDATDLSTDELSDLSLMTELYRQLKTESYSAKDLQTKIKSELGSMSFTTLVLSKGGEAHAYLSVSVSVLDSALDKVAPLVREVLLTTDFSDTEAIGRIVKQLKSSACESVSAAGHSAAISRCAAYTSVESAISEYTDGIEFCKYLKALDEGFADKKSALALRLAALSRRLVSRARLTVCHAGIRRDEFASALISIIPNGEACIEKTPVMPLGARREAIVVPSSVSYAAQTGNVLRYCDKMHGSLGVVRTVLSYGYLWGEIRVQGGAYGAGFLQRRNGCIGYYTYRDPDAARSVGKFAESVDYLRALAAEGEDVTDYVIGAVGESDILITPKVMAALSVTAYLTGDTYEDRLLRRQQMINTSHADIAVAADLIERMQSEGCVCVVGGREKLEALIATGYEVVEI